MEIQWQVSDYLDLDGPATITIGAGNYGEIAFGAM